MPKIKNMLVKLKVSVLYGKQYTSRKAYVEYLAKTGVRIGGCM